MVYLKTEVEIHLGNKFIIFLKFDKGLSVFFFRKIKIHSLNWMKLHDKFMEKEEKNKKKYPRKSI